MCCVGRGTPSQREMVARPGFRPRNPPGKARRLACNLPDQGWIRARLPFVVSLSVSGKFIREMSVKMYTAASGFDWDHSHVRFRRAIFVVLFSLFLGQFQASNAQANGTSFSAVRGQHQTKALINVSELRPGKESFATDWDIVAEVNAFDEIDRKAIVLMVRGYINVILKRTLDNALKSGGDDRLWALKSISIADAWMMKLAHAVGWARMGDYYETEAMNLAKYIRGETSLDEYLSASGKNKHVLNEVIKPYRNHRDFFSKMRDHKKLADRIGKYFVGISKVRASE